MKWGERTADYKSVQKLPKAAEVRQRSWGRNEETKDGKWVRVQQHPVSEGTGKHSFPWMSGSPCSVKGLFLLFSNRKGEWTGLMALLGEAVKLCTHKFQISRKQSAYVAAEKDVIWELWNLGGKVKPTFSVPLQPPGNSWSTISGEWTNDLKKELKQNGWPDVTRKKCGKERQNLASNEEHWPEKRSSESRWKV